jgi:copper chaperone CopZ
LVKNGSGIATVDISLEPIDVIVTDAENNIKANLF